MAWNFYRLVKYVCCAMTVSFAVELAEGVNSGFSQSASARAAGGAWLALPADPLSVARHPVSVLEMSDVWMGIGRSLLFAETHLDAAGLVYPLDSLSGLGVVLARSGTEGIPWIREGEAIPAEMPERTLSIADWIVGLSWARSVWRERVQIGVSAQGAWRKLDQIGIGFRSDFGARWYFAPRSFVHVQIEGWMGSAAHWESGVTEYSAPEMRWAAGHCRRADYLYGDVCVGWQSAGVWHRRNDALIWDDADQADSLASDPRGGEYLWKDPLAWLGASAASVELEWGWGGRVRVGWNTLSRISGWTAGAGLSLRDWLRLDYAFENHPVLAGVHRVSLGIRLRKNERQVSPSATETRVLPDVSPVSPPPVLAPEPDSENGKTWEE